MRVHAFILLAAAGFLVAGCSAKKTYPLTPEGNAQYLVDNKAKPDVVTLPDGLQYRVIAKGDGKGNTPTDGGDLLTLSYTGRLVDGTIFDQTKPGETMQVQAADVLAGWMEALERMKEGDEWEVVIPAKLGYGAAGSDKVPAGATLIYDLKFVAMRRVDAEPGEDR